MALDRDPTSPVSDRAEVVRSEEELVVGTRVVARERVRFVKRVVTETVTRTVERRREELHVEHLPLDGAEVVEGGVSEGEVADIVLHEEEVVVTTRIVPRERVRVRKVLVREERPVADTLRREEVEVEEAR